jgi:hypothetical protein
MTPEEVCALNVSAAKEFKFLFAVPFCGSIGDSLRRLCDPAAGLASAWRLIPLPGLSSDLYFWHKNKHLYLYISPQ